MYGTSLTGFLMCGLSMSDRQRSLFLCLGVLDPIG